MKIKLKVSELVANCLQRIIAEEVDYQKNLYQLELDEGIEVRTVESRTRIIREMNELADDLEKQGIQKYIK